MPTLPPIELTAAVRDDLYRSATDPFQAELGNTRSSGLDRALGQLAKQKTARILLVGCGAAFVKRHAGNTALGPLTALETGAMHLLGAQRASVRDDVTLHELGDSIDFPAKSFDAILVGDAIVVLNDPARWITELAACLAPGGALGVAVDCYAENTATHGWKHQHTVPLNLHSALGWKRMLERAGAQAIEQSRLRSDGAEAWRAKQGALFTLGRF